MTQPEFLGGAKSSLNMPYWPPGRKPTASTEQVESIASTVLGLEPEEGQLAWQERSLCSQTDPEAFYAEKGENTRDAKKMCAGCEVVPECLEYALANNERFGVWGGKSERERRKIVKERGLL